MQLGIRYGPRSSGYQVAYGPWGRTKDPISGIVRLVVSAAVLPDNLCKDTRPKPQTGTKGKI